MINHFEVGTDLALVSLYRISTYKTADQDNPLASRDFDTVAMWSLVKVNGSPALR